MLSPWICDDSWPGVKVIEGPVAPGAGRVIVAVEHGARAVISGTRVPWSVCSLTPEAAARAAMAAQLTQELSRTQARVSDQRAGYILNEHGERVLSVRLHERCDHNEGSLGPQALRSCLVQDVQWLCAPWDSCGSEGRHGHREM